MHPTANKRALYVAFLTFVACHGAGSQPRTQGQTFFPNHAFSASSPSNQSYAAWYSHDLHLLQEPSLFALRTTPAAFSYRFLWLRSFHPAVVVRLDIDPARFGTLTTKTLSGQAGFPGSSQQLSRSDSHPVAKEQVALFLTTADRVHFWTDPSYIPNDQTGTDGSDWIIEAVRNGKYHISSRWSPEPGQQSKQAVRDLGMALAINLANLQVPADQLY